MTRSMTFSVGNYYHVFNRGVDKRTVFMDKSDYERFQTLLYLCNDTQSVTVTNLRRTPKYQGPTLVQLFEREREKQLVAIGAYALLPNHFHLLIYETDENGITTFMRKLITAFTMYFNAKNERTGPLFSGKFKARQITSDEYLAYVSAYIHANPLCLIDPQWEEYRSFSTESLTFLNQYSYSSYQDYCSNAHKKRVQSRLLSSEHFPEVVTDISALSSFALPRSDLGKVDKDKIF